MSRYREAVEAGYDGPSPYDEARAWNRRKYDKQDPREPDDEDHDDAEDGEEGGQ